MDPRAEFSTSELVDRGYPLYKNGFMINLRSENFDRAMILPPEATLEAKEFSASDVVVTSYPCSGAYFYTVCRLHLVR